MSHVQFQQCAQQPRNRSHGGVRGVYQVAIHKRIVEDTNDLLSYANACGETVRVHHKPLHEITATSERGQKTLGTFVAQLGQNDVKVLS